MFPGMEEQFTPRYLNLVTAHLDSCKDFCDFFGVTTTIVPHEEGNVKGFTVKSYRNPEKDPDSFEFDYDPFWDDGSDWSHEGVDDVDLPEDNLPEIVNKIPDDDEEIIETTKTWVSKMMSDMGLCPFTKGGEQAGLPIGPVYYAVDRTTSIEEMYARYWQEVVRVEQQPEKWHVDTDTDCPRRRNFVAADIFPSALGFPRWWRTRRCWCSGELRT
jgi:hypothetical protein